MGDVIKMPRTSLQAELRKNEKHYRAIGKEFIEFLEAEAGVSIDAEVALGRIIIEHSQTEE